VTPEGSEPLRIALVHHSPAPQAVGELAEALRAAGHHAEVVSGRGVPAIERVLNFRGFAVPLTQVPGTVAELRRGAFHVAHAFTRQDALAARLWRRLSGGRVVFGCADPLSREQLADRRLALTLLERAAWDSDAVVAHSEDARAALWRWLAIEVPLLDPRDAAAHERLYREL
jgi:hypothetical protein